MPIFIYEHPKTGRIVEVIQSVHDKHEYFEKGVKFLRVFTVPQAAIDTKIDPFDSRKFAERTGKQKGSIGSLFDQAKEAGEKRKKILGHDPIEKKHWENWSKKRKGRKPPTIDSSSVIEI